MTLSFLAFTYDFAPPLPHACRRFFFIFMYLQALEAAQLLSFFHFHRQNARRHSGDVDDSRRR